MRLCCVKSFEQFVRIWRAVVRANWVLCKLSSFDFSLSKVVRKDFGWFLTSLTQLIIMRCCLWLRKCWHWFWDCRQSDKNSQQDKGKGMLEGLAINDNNICFAVHESSTFSWNLMSRCSKKRNILDEGRMFNDEWFMKYFVVQQNERALCLICRNEIACLKKFNTKRLCNSRHSYNTREF